MAGMANENYDVGGTGGALFSDGPGGGGGRPNRGPPKPGQKAMGDDYKPPQGLPDWKQPSYDEDDRVDPSKYPEPKTGPANKLLSRFFPDPVDQALALAKFFYFFFFSAFGSLFPLMAVYFKQLGMDAAQCGFLIGVRPIIEYMATPFWNSISDKFQKGKLMLLVAVASWILFTFPIGHIHPPVVSCKYYNGSQYWLKLPNVVSERSKRSLDVGVDVDVDHPHGMLLTPDTVEELPRALPLNIDKMAADLGDDKEDRLGPHSRSKRNAYDHNWASGYVVGTSPQVISFQYHNYNAQKHKDWVSPSFSNQVFERAGVQKVFFLLLLLVVIGEFFSSPAIALADSAVITLLGEQHADKYGKQRMFGSIGWGVTMFVMGIVLDHSRFDDQYYKCDLNENQRNYNVCFSVFAFLMFCAWLVATQIPFTYSVVSNNANSMPMDNMQNNVNQKAKQETEQDQKAKLLEMASKTKVFAQQLRSLPEFNAVFKAMANLRLLTFMLVAWIMGIGVGLIFTFLFWHLQDFGGRPTLFGIASVINHISEMAAYFYSFKIINKYGHIKVLAAGLLCNCLRFLYISVITWPWFVLPFEFVQGITHAAVWAACCSFISHNTDAELRSSAQGVLQGIHHGFGRFCGAVFGGMLIKTHGTSIVFRAYGVVCAVFLVIFVMVNFYNRDEGGLSTDLPDDVDPKNMAGGNDTSHLAPHGVPSAPMPRALSSSKLEDQGDQYANQVPSGQPNLNVPGAPGAAAAAENNPFLQDASYDASGSRMAAAGAGGADQQYYGRGYTQAQSGYSSSGYGLQ